jgi:hypothetical protein
VINVKKKGMINIKDKKCRCGKSQPRFNFGNEITPICCDKCKEEGMINIKNKKCHCGKSTRPSFNFDGEITPLYCSQCKTNVMIDVRHKKCYCGKHIPNFNIKGETTAIYCSECKTDNMIDITHKRCKCNKAQATFNIEGEITAVCCFECKTENMVNVTNKKCYCGKYIPCFNFKEETTPIYCSQCKEPDMIDVSNKKCKCGKSSPCFNFKGETERICCNICKEYKMVNIASKMCPNCIDWPDCHKSNKKYKGYCARCYQQLFPTDPLSFQIQSKTKEIVVRDYINLKFEGFQHDQPIYTGNCDCTHRRRVDHRKLINGTMLAIETDECQHKYYDKEDEEIRYNDLFMVHSGKWIFIRFNPDKYKDSNGKNKNPTISRRLYKLEEQINKLITKIENEENEFLLEIFYMYYDQI